MPKGKEQSHKRAEPTVQKPITNWFANSSSREAAATSSSEPTLAGIFGIDPEVLRDKFDLEPCWRYDPNQRENLAFLSPTVLLADLKIRDGGPKDKGPKEILSRVARDVLDPKQTKHYERYFFFQVPELPSTHMGYGLTSENKKHKMAITVEEAKLWSGYLDLAKRKTSGEVLHESGTSEEPMEVIYPTPKDTQAFEFEKGDAEELIDPKKSGLKRPVKGSYLIFFSILLMFYQKKLCGREDSRSEGTQIGPNKISDFLIFWILPYLLNFTQRKVNDITSHHKRISEEKGERGFKFPIIQKSAMEIIETAFHFSKTPLQISGLIRRKFKEYYGKACDKKFNLPQTEKGTPILLVPRSYQVTDMPLELEDLGSRWRDIGDVTLMDHFIEKFVKSEEIQRDFFASFEHVEKRFGVDYGIILPDQETFSEVIEQVESDFPSTFEQVQEQGQDLLSPRLGLVKHSERNRSVCFSYFPGLHVNTVLKGGNKQIELQILKLLSAS
ncbi:uncharacterized protein LOC111347682 [Stylophora pistillata]|uniref:uncharacterized protein LOC111347682 n=1 Tax=Stylophora pistillata TaxID=50429 RepID=UPI000C05041D|nr:uncharacterized protein LOC111347682 [Stylophora pistillata]